jgi:hypothetical protein
LSCAGSRRIRQKRRNATRNSQSRMYCPDGKLAANRRLPTGRTLFNARLAATIVSRSAGSQEPHADCRPPSTRYSPVRVGQPPVKCDRVDVLGPHIPALKSVSPWPLVAKIHDAAFTGAE